jgi:hypothetical protein
VAQGNPNLPYEYNKIRRFIEIDETYANWTINVDGKLYSVFDDDDDSNDDDDDDDNTCSCSGKQQQNCTYYNRRRTAN